MEFICLDTLFSIVIPIEIFIRLRRKRVATEKPLATDSNYNYWSGNFHVFFFFFFVFFFFFFFFLFFFFFFFLSFMDFFN